MQQGDKFHHVFPVSEKVYQGFIQTFEDRNVLHTDASYARSKGFRDKVVHGNILAGFISRFVGELLPLNNVIIHRQEFFFAKPVYLGNVLTLHAEVIDFSEAVKTYELRFKFLNEGNERVCYGKVQIGLI